MENRMQNSLLGKFAERLFNRATMRERLPKPVFAAWEQAVNKDVPISKDIADGIAHAMKVWAIELGATHFCHWFQPLNGKTAEKHESFLQRDDQGNAIARLSGKSLIRGETDGSSFPNGGLRDTFEATGITFWDPSSYAFVRDHILYIPSVFINFHGDKLDFKLPLLNAQRAMNQQATRVLNALGFTEVTHVSPMLGLEQEYFLVYEEAAAKRPDIQFCGRTLFAADMPKGGEYEDTYSSRINDPILAFMREVNKECWELGIFASVEHNEVAPGQYEICAIYDHMVSTVDQNLLTMDILERVAKKHGYMALLHEKPFQGMNGSGKHNNFSLLASNRDNLFDPGDMQPENYQFLLFVSAFIEAINKHQALIRMASSDAGNDHRLGGHEAPPAIMSVNLGAKLQKLFDELAKSTDMSSVELKKFIAPITNLSEQAIDAVDRNRTAPISFTGSKFEIRALGASMNAAQLNTVLCVGMAQALEKIADKLESREEGDDSLHDTVLKICHDIVKENECILYAGDCYKETWAEEAENRKLSNYHNYIDSVAALIDESSIELLERFDVLNENELHARKRILEKQFIHTVKTEARTLTRMAQEGVYPALLAYQLKLEQVAKGGYSESAVRRAKANAGYLDQIDSATLEMTDLINDIVAEGDDDRVIKRMIDELRPKMDELSALLNQAELNTPYEVWPYPSQDQLVVQ